jgi:transglutaminase-like putative cysteine protease
VTTCTIETRIGWQAEGEAAAVLLLRVADAPGQTIADEHLEVEGATVEDPGTRPGGARPVRLRTGGGPVRLRYTATVEVDQDDEVPVDVAIPTLGDLAFDLLPWTLPSRYCPSDVLTPMAVTLFGGSARDGRLLEEVRSWVQTNIAYVAGTSDVHTAADETMLRRTGVCRDLAHLTVSLLRALDVPARVVGAYALDLEPQDFHAVVEAHDGTAWRLLDATGLAPTRTVVRVATGSDAAEIAWGTTDGPISVDDLQVAITRA